MAKSSFNHDRDGLAIDALRSVFPKYWLYKDPANKFGGKEYSEDLIIEIINDDAKRTVTGAEFGVQNKTELKVWNRHVSVKLEVDDVTRLMGLQRPVLIHGYDIKTNTSYWLWLNEWYPKHSTELKDKKEIAIKIPKGNILDSRAVKKIEQHVRWENKKAKAREHAEMVARQYGNDYDVRTLTGANDFATIYNPRHDNAVPILHAIDQSISDAMNRVIERGEPVPLVGAIGFSNIPDLILENMEGTIVSAWLFPYIDESQNSMLKVELLDDNGATIFKSLFVQFRQVKPGTVLKEFEGKDSDQKATYTFTFDGSINKTTYNISFEHPEWNAQALVGYFALLKRVRSLAKIRITNLKTEQSSEIESKDTPLRVLTPEEEMVERMAAAILTIEEKLKVSLKMPERFTDKLVDRAEWVAEAVRDGAVKIDIIDEFPDDAVLMADDSAATVRNMLTDFATYGHLSIRLDGAVPEVEVKLLDHTLNLGKARKMFCNVRIKNEDELRDLLARDTIADDDSVRTVFDIDRSEVYLCFEKWLPPKPIS